jgi:lipopolysaccharide transport system ATP-binding protein
VKGRIGSLLDISLGMDPGGDWLRKHLSAWRRDGVAAARDQQRSTEIAEFSELGDYLNMPTRTYSSRMALRLAFAVDRSPSGHSFDG